MTRGARLVVGALAAAVVLVFLSLVVGFLVIVVPSLRDSGDPPVGSGSPTASPLPSTAQQSYQQEIGRDRTALFDASVRRGLPERARAKESFEISVTVCGPSAGCADTLPPATTSSGQAVTVRAGAVLMAELAADSSVQVKAPSVAQKQPLIAPDDQATWSWRLTPSRAGRLDVTISITTLRGNTDELLVPRREFKETIDVEAPKDSKNPVLAAIERGWEWITGPVAAGITAVCGAVAAAIGLVTAFRSRRRKHPAPAARRSIGRPPPSTARPRPSRKVRAAQGAGVVSALVLVVGSVSLLATIEAEPPGPPLEFSAARLVDDTWIRLAALSEKDLPAGPEYGRTGPSSPAYVAGDALMACAMDATWKGAEKASSVFRAGAAELSEFVVVTHPNAVEIATHLISGGLRTCTARSLEIRKIPIQVTGVHSAVALQFTTTTQDKRTITGRFAAARLRDVLVAVTVTNSEASGAPALDDVLQRAADKARLQLNL